ncbi:MAG TPA: PilZ domain-containing protein [Gammaproteobacteria bacterium]|nr:PilZ domain-containing protein [Gammaproteobacteria bacterium]
MINFDEKRDFIRMAADHPLQFQIAESGQAGQGTCINLSATGVLFHTDQPIATGTPLSINITPQYSVVSPFEAEAEVLRCKPNGVEGEYEIAVRILSIT